MTTLYIPMSLPCMDRFTCWMTPFGIEQINTLLLLFLPSLVTSSHLLLCNSVIPGTLSNYAAGLSRFTNFCDEFNVPELLHIPASEQLLVLFIMARGTSHAALGTMRHWLPGLELWHRINGAPWFGAHALTRAIKKQLAILHPLNPSALLMPQSVTGEGSSHPEIWERLEEGLSLLEIWE